MGNLQMGRKPDGAGKGDTPRPLGVPMDKFDNAWDAIFGNKDKLTPNQERGVKIRQMIDDLPVHEEKK